MHNTFERISIKNKMDQSRYRQKITILSSISCLNYLDVKEIKDEISINKVFAVFDLFVKWQQTSLF